MSSRFNKKRLIVKMVEGRDMIACDKGGTSDPYCIVSVGKSKKKTKVIKKTLNPVWNEEFPLEVDGPHELLIIRVFDRDLITDDKMGSCFYPLANLARGNEMDVWLPLRDVANGSIHFRLIAVDFGSEETASAGRAVNFGPTFAFFGFQSSGNPFQDIVQFGQVVPTRPPEFMVNQFRRYCYDSYDTDGNGTIEFKELIPLLADVCQTVKNPKLIALIQNQPLLLEAFKRLDKDKSGTLEYPEFVLLLERGIPDDILNSLGPVPSTMPTPEEIHRIVGGPMLGSLKIKNLFAPVLEFYGIKPTDNIFGDMLRFGQEVQNIPKSFLEKQFMRSLFASYDHDGNGTLEFLEFAQFARDVVAAMELSDIIPTSDQSLREIFTEIDKDGGGTVDYPEFLYWLEVCKLQKDHESN